MIEKSFSQDVPMVSVDRQGLMQVIFNGLLFLLKDPAQLSGTLRIETHADRQGMGQPWLQVSVWWKSQQLSYDSQLVRIEDWDFEETFTEIHDPSPAQGLILANQIVLRHSGNFQLLTTNGVIAGFQIELPLSLPYDHHNAFPSFDTQSLPVKQVSLTSDTGHLLS